MKKSKLITLSKLLDDIKKQEKKEEMKQKKKIFN